MGCQVTETSFALPVSQASEQTIMSIAGHLSRRMVEHYSHIRMEAKRVALEAITGEQEHATFEPHVHQNGNQVSGASSVRLSKSLN